MLKHIALTAVIACAAPVMSAQTAGTQSNATTRTITGMVVDKNGNPLSGAEVRATGGAETVYTEADGSYSIEVPVTLKSLTASYTGLKDHKLRTTGFNHMIFTLKEHRRTHGFVNLVGAGVNVIGSKPQIDGIIPQFGIMGGAYRSWGGYAKIMLSGIGGPSFDDGYGYDETFPATPTVTGGVIKRLSSHVNLLVGLGIGSNYNVDYYENSSSGEYSHYSRQQYVDADLAIAAEIGFMYHVKKFNIIAGVTYISPCLDGKWDDYSYYTYIDNYNDGNLAVFISIGLHI